MTILTQEHLQERLTYVPETGVFYWKKRTEVTHYDRAWNVRNAGKTSSCVNNAGYIVIRLYEKLYLAHRLAFLWMTGSFPNNEVDHIDGDQINNVWTNLRPADSSQNKCNGANLKRNNASGYRGVYWNTQKGRWQAKIAKNKKQHHLGFFNNILDAHHAYSVAAEELHGEYRRASSR